MTKFLEKIEFKDVLYILVISVTLVYSFAIKGAAVDANTKHRMDKEIHMPLERKMELFVTRREFESYKQDVIDRIFQELCDIKGDLKELRKSDSQ
jgi:hypothetical protein